MEFRPVKIQNSLLTEGETYLFKVLSKMELGHNETYFVLSDPLGYKMLMPAGFYNHYGFLPGQEIMCRVDKINCNGRMFLEPLNPWYTEGKVFDFKVVCSGRRKNIAGINEYYYRLMDVSGQTWQVRRPLANGFDDFPDKVNCFIERIKKGKLYLGLHGVDPSPGLLKQGQTYEFVILSEKVNPDDGFAYYIVEDPNGNRHFLRKKYFINYRFKKGLTFTGRIDGTFGDGLLFIEPKHPAYEIGGEYVFEVNRLEEYIFSDGIRQKNIVFKDCFDEDIKVKVDDQAARIWATCNKLKCRVFKIRKSRVEVEILGPA